MCRGQCYDGASNMKKVASDIKPTEPKALYLHCYGHSLNLAAADTLKEVKPMANTALYLHCYGHSLNLAAADTLKEVKPMANTPDHALKICKLLKFSPRRDGIFEKFNRRSHHMHLDCVPYVRPTGLFVLHHLRAFAGIIPHC